MSNNWWKQRRKEEKKRKHRKRKEKLIEKLKHEPKKPEGWQPPQIIYKLSDF